VFTNLLIVVAAGLLAPLALGFFPRARLPPIVLEIVLGIVIGPPGLGWVKPDAAVSILALVGLAFLLFLSGLEIDAERLRSRIVKLTALGFAVSFAIAILIGTGLRSGGFVKSPLFVAIVLVATSLGVIFPVLKDSSNLDSSLGELVIAAASIADFGSIILLSLFFSGKSSTSTAGRLILLGMFGLVVVLVGIAIASAERSRSLSRVLRRLQDTTAQIRARGLPAADRVHRAGAERRPGDDPRRVRRRSAALAARPGRDDNPSPVPAQARGGRLRGLHPDLLRRQRPDLRCERAVRDRLHHRPGAAVPARDPPRARPARIGLRARARPLALADRGHPAGHVAAVHRGRDPDRPAARHRLPRQRRRPGRRRAAVRRDLPGARARPAPPRAPGNRRPRALPTPVLPVLTAEDRALARASDAGPAA
jgi:hypothetical protein